MDLAIITAVVVVALAFDYTNGFHDAANAIATSVSTRALTPRIALAMAVQEGEARGGRARDDKAVAMGLAASRNPLV